MASVSKCVDFVSITGTVTWRANRWVAPALAIGKSCPHRRGDNSPRSRLTHPGMGSAGCDTPMRTQIILFVAAFTAGLLALVLSGCGGQVEASSANGTRGVETIVAPQVHVLDGV